MELPRVDSNQSSKRQNPISRCSFHVRRTRWSLFSWADQTGLWNASPGLKAIKSENRENMTYGEFLYHKEQESCSGIIPLAASHSHCWWYPGLCSTLFSVWSAIGVYMSSHPEVGNLHSTQSPGMSFTRAWVPKSVRHCTNHRSVHFLRGR